MSYRDLGGIVLRLSDGASIPRDRNNADFQAFLKWEADGGVIEPPPPPPPPTKDQQDAEAARQYARLKALVSMSPSEVEAWVAANVNNLAQAKEAITTLAVAVSILGRRI